MTNDGALVELREESPGKLVLRGYASVSERWYPVGNMFEEKVNRGTWRRCLADGPDTVLVADHEGLAFARTKTPSGAPTLLLSETDRGLHCEAFLDATAPRVQDLRSTSENAGLQMSVGFICSQDSWNEDRSRRELIQASVHRGDVTVCNYGANNAAAATITARGEAGEAERRAHAQTLSGSRERRMCPILEGYDLDERSTLTVARKPPLPLRRSYVELAKAKRAKLRAGRGTVARSARPVRSYIEEQKLKRAQALGRRHVEEPAPFGPEWLITKPTDVGAAVRKVKAGHATGPKEAEIKRYIAERAADLHVTSLVPVGWANARSRAQPRSERRAEKYTQKEKDELARRGLAFKNPDGHGSYPAVDREDVDNAVQAIGRAPANLRNAIRRFVMRRAAALKVTDLIPDNWKSDGSLRQARQDEPDADDACPACEGTGECSACAGTGSMASESVGGQSQ